MSNFDSRLRCCSGAFILIVVAIFTFQAATFGQNKESEKDTSRLFWSDVDSTNNLSVLRARVPGGWFVSVKHEGETNGVRSTFYYYDPEHAWDGTSQPK